MWIRSLLLGIAFFLGACSSPGKDVVKTDHLQLARDYSFHSAIIPVRPEIVSSAQPWQTVNANLRRKVYFNDRQTVVIYEATKKKQGGDVDTQYHYHDLTGYVISGNLLVKIDQEVQNIGPGGVYIVPSNVHYAVLPLTDQAAYLEFFTPAREDLRAPPLPSRFDENDVKSVIFSWYAHLDKLADVTNYLPLLADRGLFIKLPGTVIRSRDDFKNWYAAMLKKTRTNASKVTNVTVKTDARGGFLAEFTVSWEARTFLEERRTFRSRQRWLLADQGGTTPVIVSVDYDELSDIFP
ncbi:MAG TPA: hypothetical protein PK175_05190 [Syntrophales bacterium]|jgi:quercetin dioxygenase-like cupin family protein|nr:hypothetical protein [Syntrophales bacterium]HOU77259.1 hypothetical protein [Syntrophales bacterium]HPC32690.1 hypothetical protein [Syntrophales bacterium]HQG34249.1 hypothetical protein [Syntrophales bacterium]HRR47248.1 hypothetical protein [Syntrophales bacterium]